MSNKPRASPRIAALRSRISVTERPNARPRSLLRSTSEATVTHHTRTQPRPTTAMRTPTALRRSSNVAGTTPVTKRRNARPHSSLLRRTTGVASEGTNTHQPRPTTAMRTPPVVRPTRMSAAISYGLPKTFNIQDSPEEPVFVDLVSPSTDSSNCTDRRQFTSMATVIYCPICFMDIKRSNKRTLVTACGHIFCDVCLHEAYRIRNVCAMCKQYIAAADFREIYY